MRRIQPAKTPAGEVAEVQAYPVATGETFPIGAPVTLESGELNEIDVNDVTNIIGIALQAASVAGTPDFGDEVEVAIANATTQFAAPCADSGAFTTDLSGVTVGDQYGVLKVSGEWYVDLDDSSNVVFEVVKIYDDIDMVLVKFISSTLAQP